MRSTTSTSPFRLLELNSKVRAHAFSGTDELLLTGKSASAPCVDAGDYLFWLADRLARRCSPNYALGNGRCNAAFRLQLTPQRRECAICYTASSCVQLERCTHATFCVECLASHVHQKLKAGNCPSCPMCVQPFATREILSLVNVRGMTG